MREADGDLFVGIDAGTTGVTVAIVDAGGKMMAGGYREYTCQYPHPGWVEQDVDEVWRGLCAACRSAIESSGAPAETFRSLGFSSQRGTFVLVATDERPLAPSVVWNDSRAGEMEAVIAEAVAPERYREITGTPLSASWAAAKILWLTRHRPEQIARARWICNGQEYFLRRLGAEGYRTDPASLTLNGMMDIARLDWSDEVLAAIGIDRGVLPPVGRSATRVGRVSAEAAAETGLPEGLPLAIGGGDQQCAAVGAGVIRQGMAEITIGTAAMMVAHLDDPGLVTGPAPYIGGHAVPGKWDLEGGAFASGACLRWWRDNFGGAEVEAAARTGRSAYDLVVAEAMRAPAGARGLVFHPFLAGQVTPYYDARARGAFLGLGLNHDRACMIRALLEGCACEMRLMVDAFDRDLAGGLDELRLTGGGSRSAAYVQLIADVLGRAVVQTRNPECTVLGAAILGAVAVDAFPNLEAAVTAMVQVARRVEPRERSRGLYDALFEVYRTAYERMAAAGLHRAVYDY